MTDGLRLLTLYPEAGDVYLWTSGGPVSPQWLQLSTPLIAELERWYHEYEHDTVGWSEDEFEAEAERLVERLQEELGPAWRVVLEL